jgi:methionine synthase II (cobalamin-independent)
MRSQASRTCPRWTSIAMAWSIVRDDQPRTDTARAVALALHNQAHARESAGRCRANRHQNALLGTAVECNVP